MIKIAVLTAAEYDWSHGVVFSEIINGCSAERARTAGIKFVPPSIKPLCEDVQVVAVWTPDLNRTKIVAQALGLCG